jgi:phosphoribosylformylglycinamidine synthase II
MTPSIFIRQNTPFSLFKIDVLKASDKQLKKIIEEMGLGLSRQEMNTVKTYFKTKGRNPTDLELQTISQTWSEHCFHKTFKGRIRYKGKDIDSLFKTYIARATDEIKAPWCFSVFEDNAGIVELDEDYGIAAKVETHNHPSAVEPFGGAATGVGGVIRDILGVWADPIACTDVLGFGPLDFDYERLPPGVKHPKYSYIGVVAGIGSYGNNMGIPTVNGAIYFDESYTGNVVVYCGCIGLLPLKKIKREAKPNEIIVLAGGKTGRDGIHGVTFASAELTEKSEVVSRPAVQIADPIEEEKLKRAIIEIRDLELASAITDLGGGGLSSAVGEIAHKYGCGATVELEKVPLKYADLAPWEIYISESQERMLLTVPAENLEKVKDIFGNEDVQATAIGQLTAETILRISYRDVEVANISVPFLFKPPISQKTARLKHRILDEPHLRKPNSLERILLNLLSSPNIASRESVVRSYDHEVKGNTVLKPLQGSYAGPNDASILKPLNNSWNGIAISCGINPNYGRIDAYWMAASAVDEAVRNNVAVGGRRIALLDNFTWGNPERPERLGSLVEACKACYDVAKAYGTPFISGKDSLYNESPLGPVTPSLLITALGLVPDIRRTVSMDAKTAGDPIYVVGQTFKELGGSEYYRLYGYLGKSVPETRVGTAREIFNAVTRAIDQGLMKACHDLSEGGLAVAAAEMAFSGGHGMEIDLRNVPRKNVDRDDFVLFSQSNSRFLIEVSNKNRDDFETLMSGKPHAEIGRVEKTPRLRIVGTDGRVALETPVDDLRQSWKQTFSGEA